MSTKTVQFSVDVNHLKIISGSFQVFGIVENHVGVVNNKTPFENNTFEAEIKENESQYYSVTVWIDEYILEGINYKTGEKPISFWQHYICLTLMIL
ncbi:hypothetical protein ACFOEQ_03385 [Chryseobacterium arachidis]|uniref:hypothetical protein n=1 Tax=Chryseobacterium arachidis TaxID=1416778 RepID=UPI003613F4D9